MSEDTKFNYIRTTFAHESEALKAVRENITDPNDQISLSPQEGKFLALLVKLSGAKNIIEVGTLGGYSALWMAGVLPADGKIITLEKDENRAAKAAAHFARFDTSKKIELRVGDALESLAELEGPFDMIFIDADKLNYMNYLNWAEKNIRKGGLIVGDNTFLFGAVYAAAPVDRVRKTAFDAMTAFNARLGDDRFYTGILLPTPEGMTVAVKNF